MYRTLCTLGPISGICTTPNQTQWRMKFPVPSNTALENMQADPQSYGTHAPVLCANLYWLLSVCKQIISEESVGVGNKYT
jgi:hypothetical protein